LIFWLFLFLKEEVWQLSYLEPPENEIRFNAAIFAHSLEGYGLRDDKAKSLESLLSIIELVCYSDITKVGEVDFKSLNLGVLKQAFEELMEYQSEENGEDDCDLYNEGQTIVEINRLAGMFNHINDLRPVYVYKKQQRRFF
jgi:hypothetical protein